MRLIRRLALRTPEIVGSPRMFLLAIVLAAAWVVTGPFVGFGNAWLLWPSAVASVVTFLIVFSLQYTQNRDTRAIQLKLDELIRSLDAARTQLVRLEELSDEELTEIEEEFAALREEDAATEAQ